MTESTLRNFASDLPFDDAAAAGKAGGLVPPLLSIARSTRSLLKIKLAEIGLFSGQDEMLLALRPDRAMTVSTLADTLAVRSSTISNMLDRLAKRNYIQRAADGRDARRTMVRLTPAGSAIKEVILRMRAQLEGELTDAIAGEDRDTVLAELETINALLIRKLRPLR